MALHDKQCDKLESKLDILIRLLAMTVGAGLPITERAPMLQRAGLDRNAIAAACDASAAVISVRLAEAKKHKASKKRNN